MELSGYLATARRWWWTLLVAVWIAGLAGYVVATRIPPTYEARATMLVGPIEGDLNTLRASGQLALTYAELVTVEPRLEEALRRAAVDDLSVGEFKRATRVTANDTTRTLVVRVQDGDRERAATLANTLAALLDELVSTGTGRPEGALETIEFAAPPSSPIAPQVSLIALLTAFAGFLVALVVVVLIEYVGATVRSRDDIQRLVPVPFLGQIEGTRSGTVGLVVEQMPASRMASSYRIVAAKIVFAESEEPLNTLLVVGAQSGDGAGETAANLAMALATSGRRTVLVDGDDVDGEATRLLGLTDRKGLCEVVRRQADITDVIVSHGADLDVVPIGRTTLDRLDDGLMLRILDRLSADHDLVVVAGSPTLGSAESLVYARATDATVVVVRRDETKREALAHAVESLTLVGSEVTGVVLDARSGGRFRRLTPGPATSTNPPIVTTERREPVQPTVATEPAAAASAPTTVTTSAKRTRTVAERTASGRQASPVRRTKSSTTD